MKTHAALEKAARKYAYKSAAAGFGDYYGGIVDFIAGALWLARRLKRVSKRYSTLAAASVEIAINEALNGKPARKWKKK